VARSGEDDLMQGSPMASLCSAISELLSNDLPETVTHARGGVDLTILACALPGVSSAPLPAATTCGDCRSNRPAPPAPGADLGDIGDVHVTGESQPCMLIKLLIELAGAAWRAGRAARPRIALANCVASTSASASAVWRRLPCLSSCTKRVRHVMTASSAAAAPCAAAEEAPSFSCGSGADALRSCGCSLAQRAAGGGRETSERSTTSLTEGCDASSVGR
jgi:hypothetical protein